MKGVLLFEPSHQNGDMLNLPLVVFEGSVPRGWFQIRMKLRWYLDVTREHGSVVQFREEGRG